MKQGNVKWHKMTAQAAVTQLHTNAACGLTRKAARSRYRKFGANTLFDDVKKDGVWSVWKSIVTDPAILLLLFVLLFALFFSARAPIVAAIAVLIISVALMLRLVRKISFLLETVSLYRAPTVLVLREGSVFEISSRYLVPGDILLLQKGDVVPCDCRLLEADGEVCTRLIYRDASGRRTALEQIKHADLVYPYEATVFAPSCENILYGKSEMIRGNARALVTEIGIHTYMGAMQLSSQSSAKNVGNLGKGVCFGAYSYIRMYSLILIFLLLPLTVIGLFSSPDSHNILRVFLPLCALCGVGSHGVLLFYFHGVMADGYMQCVLPIDGKGKRALPKSLDVMEKLPAITDLIVLGTCASSDGVMHLHRAALGNGEVSLMGKTQPALSAICEAYEILFSAPSASLATAVQNCSIRDLENPTLRDELTQMTAFDLEALRIRLKRAKAFYERDKILLDVEMRSGAVRFCFTDRVAALYTCTGYEYNGKILPLDAEQRQNLFRFVDSVKSENAQITIVLKQVGGRTVLLGVLSCREQIQQFLPSVIEELSESGVRVSFFLQNDSEDALLYARAAKLPSAILRASELPFDADLTKYIEKYRVFLGFSEKQIRDFLKKCKADGCRIATLASDSESSTIQAEADICIACDPLMRDVKDFDGEVLQAISKESGFFDARYSRALALRAGLLLPRADQSGGGLFSFLHTLTVSRAVRFRMQLLFKYLISVQLFRTLLTLLSACTGVGLLSGAQMLFGGLVFDLISVFWILSIFVPIRCLRTREPIDGLNVKKIIGDRQLLVSPILSAGVIWLYGFIMSSANAMSSASAVVFAFFSVMLVQITALYKTVLGSGVRWEWKNDVLPAIFLFAPILLVLGLSYPLPIVAAGSELLGSSLLGILSLPLGPIVYLWGYRFLLLLKSFFKSVQKRIRKS